MQSNYHHIPSLQLKMFVLRPIILGQLIVLASNLNFDIEKEILSRLSDVEIVEQLRESKKLFQLFEQARVLKEKEEEEENIVSKRESDATESKTEPKDMCSSTEHWIKPSLKFRGKNITMMLGNETRLEEMIKVNHCSRPGEECEGGTSLGYPTWCEQVFRQYKVIVHDDEKMQHAEEIFKYPSFCICKIGKTKKKSYK